MNYEDALRANIEHALERAAECYDKDDCPTAEFWRLRALDLDMEMERVEQENHWRGN